MNASHEQIQQKRSIVEALREERSTSERRLALRKNELVAIEQRVGQTRTQHTAPKLEKASTEVGDQLAAGASRYARKKGVLAARAIRDGKGDKGYLRDLADAAVFGSVDAAMALFEITRAAVTEDKSRQVVESFAWISLVSTFSPADSSAAATVATLASQLSPEQARASRELLGLLSERRSALLSDPFDQGN